MDNLNPSTVTLVIKGDNEHYRDFLAHLVVMFLVYHKNLDIETLHRRATALRIDLKYRQERTQPIGAIKHFGYLKEIIEEFYSRNYLWKAFAKLFSSVNYNMVVLHITMRLCLHAIILMMLVCLNQSLAYLQHPSFRFFDHVEECA